MTLDQFLATKGVAYFMLGHVTKYTLIVNAIGLDKLVQILPADKQEIAFALSKDEHLNNIKLARWDNASAYVSPMLKHIGITCFSLAERVCILKRAATMWIGGDFNA